MFLAKKLFVVLCICICFNGIVSLCAEEYVQSEQMGPSKIMHSDWKVLLNILAGAFGFLFCAFVYRMLMDQKKPQIQVVKCKEKHSSKKTSNRAVEEDWRSTANEFQDQLYSDFYTVS